MIKRYQILFQVSMVWCKSINNKIPHFTIWK